MLVSTGGPSGTRVWDVATGRLRLELPNAVSACLAMAPDGKTLATGQAGGVVRLWDTKSWKERITLPAHRDLITSVAFSADSKMLATASQDGTTKLWQIAGGKSALVAGK